MSYCYNPSSDAFSCWGLLTVQTGSGTAARGQEGEKIQLYFTNYPHLPAGNGTRGVFSRIIGSGMRF